MAIATIICYPPPVIPWEVNAYDRKKIWVDSGVAKSMERFAITTAGFASISGRRLKLEGSQSWSSCRILWDISRLWTLSHWHWGTTRIFRTLELLWNLGKDWIQTESVKWEQHSWSFEAAQNIEQKVNIWHSGLQFTITFEQIL